MTIVTIACVQDRIGFTDAFQSIRISALRILRRIGDFLQLKRFSACCISKEIVLVPAAITR